MQGDCYNKKTLKKLQRVELSILKEFDSICRKNGLQYFLCGGSAIGFVRHGGFIPWDDDIDVGMSRYDYDKFLEIANKQYSSKYMVVNNDTNRYFPLMNTRWGLKGTEFKTNDLKDIPGDFGIFLDIFCFDNIPDDDKLMKKQGTRAWLLGKFAVLSGVKKPVVYYNGIKIDFFLFAGHYVLKIFHLTSRFFYKRALKWALMYKDDDTKRFAYMFDPKRFTSIVSKNDIYPIKTGRFEGIDVMIPNRIEKYLSVRYGDYMTLPPVEERHNHPPYRLRFHTKKK